MISGAGERYYAALMTHDAELTLWDAHSGRSLQRFTGLNGAVNSVAFSPDGKLIAVGSGYRRNFVALSPDGEQVLSGSGDRTLMLWNPMSGRRLQTLPKRGEWVLAAAFSPDSRFIASVVKLWDVATGDEVLTLRGHSAGVVCLAFSPDGRSLVSGSIDWTARVWDATPLDETVELGPDADASHPKSN